MSIEYRVLTSETVKPKPHPQYGDNYERGLDPWHVDSYPKEFRHLGTTGPRRSGWFLMTKDGSAIAFVADGTPVE
jgi:hypothetical protein